MDRLAGRLRTEAGCLRLEWAEGVAPAEANGSQAVVLGPAGRRREDLARRLAAAPDDPAGALAPLRPEAGGFAFALWEPEREQLSLGCDPIGLQNLYFGETEDGIRFGGRLSDVAPRGSEKLHLAACEHFLRYLTVPAGRTLLGGVRRVAPGERRFFPEGVREAETLLPLSRVEASGRAESADRLLGALRASLRAVTAEADGDETFGLLLSGGIDSTALLALLREAHPGPIVAIHASPEGSPDRPFASRMAERFGADLLDVTLTARDARESAAWIVASMEAPGGNASAVANCRAFALAQERGVRRVISGLGSDEIFCGHGKHLLVPWWPLLARMSPRLRGILPLPLRNRRQAAVRRALAVEAGAAEMHTAMYEFFGTEECEALRGGLARFAQPPAPQEWRSPGDAGFPPGYGAEVLQADLNLWLRSALAPMAGALAAANGTTLILPFCSHEMICLSASLPLRWKVRGRTGKRILREALKGFVPREIFHRPRQGFTVPMGDWLRNGLAEMAKELLDPRRVERWYLLDRGGPGRLLREHLQGRAEWSLPLWAWMTFSLWHERFVEGAESP